MADNKRIIYSAMQFAVSKNGATDDFIEVHGVQVVGMSITFNLEPVFEIGKLSIYENKEGVPEVSITAEKVMDGHPPLFLLMTNGAPNPTLIGRSGVEFEPGLGIFDMTLGYATGTPKEVCHCPRSVVDSVAWNFPVDGNFTESVTASSNTRLWKNIEGGDTLPTFEGLFTQGDIPVTTVNRRENLLYTPLVGSPSGVDANGATNAWVTVLPKDIRGVSSTGTNVAESNGNWRVPVQSISVSSDFNRVSIYELGKKTYYNREMTFPVEVRCEIEVLMRGGDKIEGSEAGGHNGAPAGSNLRNQTIRIQTEEGTMLDLGIFNKLMSFNWTGGDATQGGSNVIGRYSYMNQNDLTVTHPLDPSF